MHVVSRTTPYESIKGVQGTLMNMCLAVGLLRVSSVGRWIMVTLRALAYGTNNIGSSISLRPGPWALGPCQLMRLRYFSMVSTLDDPC